jgi:putative ABC transport system ATP-binding protein
MSQQYPPLIQLTNIQKTYHTGSVKAHILKGISLNISEGEFVAIMGQSGSGKSTLMNIMGFLDVHDDGKYIFNEKMVEKYDEEELAKIRNIYIGFVFQMFYLLPKIHALDNVQLPMLYASVSEKERKKRAEEALTAVGLEKRMYHKPNELSGGQQQRVSIARALVNNPKVLFADEPTGNLDSASGNEVMNIFQRLHQEGKTIIMITHEEDIAAHASRKIVILDGKIVEDTKKE